MISIANELGRQWIWVGRLLELDDTALDGIKEEHGTQYDWSYEMLSLWARKNSTQATYSWLAKALCHRVVGLDNVAKKYCIEHQGGTGKLIDPLLVTPTIQGKLFVVLPTVFRSLTLGFHSTNIILISNIQFSLRF